MFKITLFLFTLILPFRLFAQDPEEDYVELGTITIIENFEDNYSVQVFELKDTGFISLSNLLGENSENNLGKTFDFNYLFQNPTSEPIIIRKISSNCGCIKTLFTEEPIGGGATRNIGFKFEVMEPGPFKVVVSIYGSDTQKSFLKVVQPIIISN